MTDLTPDQLESAVKKMFIKCITAYGTLIKGTWLESRTRRSGGDWIGCVCGVYFSIEFKRPKGGHLTGLQAKDVMEVVAAGGQCFVVCDNQTLDVALDAIDRLVAYHLSKRVG